MSKNNIFDDESMATGLESDSVLDSMSKHAGASAFSPHDHIGPYYDIPADNGIFDEIGHHDEPYVRKSEPTYSDELLKITGLENDDAPYSVLDPPRPGFTRPLEKRSASATVTTTEPSKREMYQALVLARDLLRKLAPPPPDKKKPHDFKVGDRCRFGNVLCTILAIDDGECQVKFDSGGTGVCSADMLQPES